MDILIIINNRYNQDDLSRNIIYKDNYLVIHKKEKQEDRDNVNHSYGCVSEVDNTTPRKVQNKGNTKKDLNKDETKHYPYF